MILNFSLPRKSLRERIDDLATAIRTYETQAGTIQELTRDRHGQVLDEKAEDIIKNSIGFGEEFKEILGLSRSLEEAELNDRTRVSVRRMSRLAIDVDVRVSHLANEIKTLMSSALALSSSRQQTDFLCRFAFAGSLGTLAAIGTQHGYSPEKLRRKAHEGTEYTWRTCEERGCFKSTDDLIGSSMRTRTDELSESVRHAIAIKEKSVETEPNLRSAEKIKYIHTYIELTKEVVVAVGYFHYAQNESRILVDRHVGVTAVMYELANPKGKRSKQDVRLLQQEISRAFADLKTLIAEVVVHHDAVLEELKEARRKADGNCNANLCKERFKKLIADIDCPTPSRSGHVYGWICRQCAYFTEDNVRLLLKDNMKKPILELPSSSHLVHITDAGFSKVYKLAEKHIVRGFEHPFGRGLVVKVALSGDKSTCQRIFRELLIWSKLNHAHIVPLLGYYLNGDIPCPVIPFMEGGTLLDHIHDVAMTPENRRMRLGFMCDVANALAYMHEHPLRIVHADLKADNVLLHNGRAYLTDFGISRMVAFKGLSTKVHGVANFRAPELFGDKNNSSCDYLLEEYGLKPSTFSDVYSFGTIFYHVCTGQVPFGLDRQSVEATRRLDPYKLPEFEVALDRKYEVFIEDCLQGNPSSRPSARAVYDSMVHFLKA